MSKPAASKRNASVKITTASSAAKPTSEAEPAAPFTKATSAVTAFLSTLDRSKVYITHIDTLPAPFKRRIFTIPILLNLTIALLLLWRAYTAIPTYLSLILSALGQHSSTSVDAKSKTWSQLIWIVLRRTLTFLFDFLLVRIVGPWPFTFFLERPANPISWRWHIGFRDQEIYVRVSRGWGSEELMKGSVQGADNPFFKVRVDPAVEESLLRGKTGYLLVDQYWDLDFEVMIRATEMVDKRELEMTALDGTVWAYAEEFGWVCWRVRERPEDNGKGEDDDGEAAARSRIESLKSRLAALGKDNLFYRWIEIIQYESSQPDGMNACGKANAVKKLKDMLEKEGLDLEEFVAAFGGLDEIPGLVTGAPDTADI